MQIFEEKLLQFTKKLEEVYKNDSSAVLKTHYLDRAKTFRINFLKPQNVNETLENLKNEGIEFTKISLENFYIVTKGSEFLSKTKVFNDKLIYIQEPSSALPVIELAPAENEKILDMCASPGSKTSLIQNLTNNNAQVTAIEKNRNRFFKLKENLINNEVKNVTYINADANRIIFIKPELTNYFDKVLVDVPCTTEAQINLNNEDSLKEWKLSNAKNISKLQRGLLNSAFKMLKPKGTLIYSTCTYSVEENEAVVDWFLKKNQDAKIVDINLNLSNLQNGITEYKNKIFNESLRKTIRVIPNNEFTAFYLTKITKL